MVFIVLGLPLRNKMALGRKEALAGASGYKLLPARGPGVGGRSDLARLSWPPCPPGPQKRGKLANSIFFATQVLTSVDSSVWTRVLPTVANSSCKLAKSFLAVLR